MPTIENPFRWVETKKKEFERALKVEPRLLLKELCDIDLCCTNCGVKFRPPWFDKRYSLHPIKLANGLLAVPSATSIRCSKCDSSIKMKLPTNTVEGQSYTFIDEAYRSLENGVGITNYSSVSISRGMYEKAVRSLVELKNSLANKGYMDSGDYLHITEFKEKDPKLAKLIVQEVAEWIQEFQLQHTNALRFYSSTAVFKKNENSSEMKRLAFEAYFQVSQIEASRGKLQHVYHLENDGRQGWMFKMIKELSHSLIFPFIASGLPMVEPKILGKGEGLTELADVIAFISSRHYYDSLLNKPLFADSKILGPVHHIFVNEEGMFKYFGEGISDELVANTRMMYE